MITEISLRPHHIAKFAVYYFEGFLGGDRWNHQYSQTYSPEFVQGTTSLFELLIQRAVEKVRVTDGLDNVCQICEKTCKKKANSCSGSEDLQAEPEALLTMAKSRLIVGETYPIKDFLRRIERVGCHCSQEVLLKLIKEAYTNFRKDRPSRFKPT
jgi:hypothetical protein